MNRPTDLFQKTSFYTNEIKSINDQKGETFWIKPSDIVRDTTSTPYNTFTSSFGSCESETTAYLICKFFTNNGDCWYPVDPKLIDEFVKTSEKEYFQPVKNFASRNDYAEIADGKILFTNRFIERCAGFREKDAPEAWKVKNVFEL